jgi:molybdate transport system substrate-binding protein
LVLWSAKKDYVDDKGNILKSSSFKRLAIANPKLAPYGEAAFETLKNMNLLTTLENKIVFGDNINQTYQFVQSENAELGFVALSQIFMNGKITQGSAWLIPYGLHSPIKQDAVILNQGKNNDTVSSFMKYLHSEKCMKIIKNFGYEIE